MPFLFNKFLTSSYNSDYFSYFNLLIYCQYFATALWKIREINNYSYHQYGWMINKTMPLPHNYLNK